MAGYQSPLPAGGIQEDDDEGRTGHMMIRSPHVSHGGGQSRTDRHHTRTAHSFDSPAPKPAAGGGSVSSQGYGMSGGGGGGGGTASLATPPPHNTAGEGAAGGDKHGGVGKDGHEVLGTPERLFLGMEDSTSSGASYAATLHFALSPISLCPANSPLLNVHLPGFVLLQTATMHLLRCLLRCQAPALVLPLPRHHVIAVP